ncbi:MAG: ATP-binding protein [bacterium]|nr:ATP-binding protein [bacterium]
MLSALRLENFKGFDKHELPLNDLTVIVGQNNAGKSTIVEALRLLAVVVGRYRHLSYRPVPSWLDIPGRHSGVSPSLKNMEINFDSIFHRYGDPPAEITASFSDKSSISIYLAGEDKIYAVIRDQEDNIIKSKQQADQVILPTVSILPQVAPVQRQETILSKDYVKSAMSSSLAPLHFRNQLNVLFDLFPEFQKIVENTWHGIRVLELIGQGGLPTESLSLQVRNEDFVAEVAAMGHGLQMWLQTMWFLTRSQKVSTVILDEPDVYMHADLQRRLIRFLKNRYPQIILTTHSVEIMAEVEPEQILVVDKRRSKSTMANSLPAVQKLIENVGSVHNIHLSRLWHARRCILIEGEDLKILKQFQDTLFPNSDEPFDSIPLLAQDRSLGPSGANKAARKILKEKKEKHDGLLTIVSGKVLISSLSQWSQSEFSVSFNAVAIAREMEFREISKEMLTVITAIEKGQLFT